MKYLSCIFLCLLLFLPVRAEEAPLTRGQAAVLLWQDAGGVPYDITAHPFTDLAEADDAVVQAVAWAWNTGLVQGVGEHAFAPDRTLTRAEWATLLRRNGARLGLDTWLADGAAACNDFEGVTDWGGDDIYWACITDRLTWSTGGRLDPLGAVTVSQALEGLHYSQQGW